MSGSGYRWRHAGRACIFGLIFALAQSGGSPLAAPAARVAAETALAEWMDGLVGRTGAEVARELGPAGEKTHWVFEGKAEILLKYRTAQQAELNLYFYQGRVIKASYQQMSK